MSLPLFLKEGFGNISPSKTSKHPYLTRRSNGCRKTKRAGEGVGGGGHKIRTFVFMICLTSLWNKTPFLISFVAGHTLF